MSCLTSPAPLRLLWNNNTVSNDGKAINNGMAVFVGTPPQKLSLSPSLSINNTLVNNIATCNTQSNTSCISILGGTFNPDSSSSYRVSSLGYFNGSLEGEDISYLFNAPYVYFNDEFQVADYASLSGFPFVMETDILQYGALGLGSNSTFLSGLVAANLVPSNSFSVYTGIHSDVQAGAVIVGGYSEQFYEGQLYSQQASPTWCPACFNVTGMRWQDSNGSLDLLSSLSQRSFIATVDPYQPYLVLPADSFAAVQNRTQASIGTQYSVLSYLTSDVPDGELVITLENGLETTVPNYALFDPPAYDGGLLQSGRNNSEVYGLMTSWDLVTGVAGTDNVGILGVPYAAFTYIIRDYERNNVSIAKAANITAATFPGNFTTICSTNPAASSKTKGSGHSSHAGAIAGGVIGGVVGLALICLAVWWFFFRNKKKQVGGDPVEAPVSAEHKGAMTLTSSKDGTTSSSSDSPLHTKPSELNASSSIQEAPTQAAKQEMSGTGDRLRSELPA